MLSSNDQTVVNHLTGFVPGEHPRSAAFMVEAALSLIQFWRCECVRELMFLLGMSKSDAVRLFCRQEPEMLARGTREASAEIAKRVNTGGALWLEVN